MTRKTLHQPRDPLDFTPVPRRTRKDGWTVERQRAFIDTLARSGSLRVAAAVVNMSEAGAIYLRTQPGAESFDAAWDAAVATGSERVRNRLVDHALNGIPEDVYYAGKVVGERRRFNHRSMMWIVETGDKQRARKDGQLSKAVVDEARATIEKRVQAIRRARLRCYAQDPAKRAAYEVLHGAVDWTVYEPGAPNPSAPTLPAT